MALLMLLGAVVAVVLLVAAYVTVTLLNLWLQAKASDIPLTFLGMLMMRLRGVDPARILHAMVSLHKAGVAVEAGDLEAHVLSGGSLSAVTDAVISAEKADLDVGFHMIAAIDLAGRDVVDAVLTRVNPKVVVCPPEGSELTAISGVSKDGVRLGARARVTVRTRLDRLVGGGGEDTVVARVGEGIVTAIGRTESHREILERPEMISEYLLSKGLDSGTCFEILSVDIADVDVKDNVGARLSSTRAETDKRIAQAKAEMRRAAAVAVEHEMKARTTEMHGRVVAAKAVEPFALSSAFREANMGRRRPYSPTVNPRIRWLPHRRGEGSAPERAPASA